ncbi:hypothetical protein EJ04DRAFT_430335 [Polyplosphaeria fusca]|uniref:Uncharacterized protein n=1 Tax=Polyplosphaeria fusca TaxID=682080 RepID=A0A9P4R2Z0_9PLEO|nr:hypothetical protein EJ04DRAFT_430335 [Polyplosphaeria fusca]
MLFLATLSTLLTAALAAPAPAPALAERQGGAFVAVGIKYATGGCSGTNGVGDPIFGNGNACQPINRFSDEPPVVSYNATSVCSGGSGKCNERGWGEDER